MDKMSLSCLLALLQQEKESQSGCILNPFLTKLSLIGKDENLLKSFE